MQVCTWKGNVGLLYDNKMNAATRAAGRRNGPFDVGIVRCVEMYAQTGMYKNLPECNFFVAAESGRRPKRGSC